MKKYISIILLMLTLLGCELFTKHAIRDEGKARKTTRVDILGSPVEIGATPVYLRDNSGTLEYSNNGADWYAVGSGGGAGDMTKAVYDPGDDTRVDNAETLTDGTNSATAAQVRTHLDDTTIHFVISDGITATTSVWSSQKISNELQNITISEFALRGTGTGNLASATSSPSGHFNNDTFSLYGVVVIDQLARAESFYKRIETEYSNNILNFGKDSSNRLQITIGSNTYTSGTVFTSDNTGIPLEIGVICDKAGGTVAFFYGGKVEASQAATYSYPTINLNEQHILGDGLDGDIFFFSITKDMVFTASSRHTPLREGLSQCPSCVIHYNMNEGEGSTLTDRYAEQKGTSGYDLSISGSWQEYPEKY